MTAAQETFSGWVSELGDAAPAPGGGAAAAVMAALGAALASMVAGYSTGAGGGFAPSPELVACMGRLGETARSLAAESLAAADEDARASTGFAAAFRLPARSEQEVRERDATIDAATLVAARSSVAIGRLATQALVLLEDLVDDGNPLVLADVGVGAAAVAGALRAAAVNTEANLAAAAGPGHGATLSSAVRELDDAAVRADAVVAAVRAAITSSGSGTPGT